MSSVSSRTAKPCTKNAKSSLTAALFASLNSLKPLKPLKRRRSALMLMAVITLIGGSGIPAQAWEIDFSRRQVDFNRITNQSRMPATEKTSEPAGLLQKALDVVEVSQDIVILNTEKGFVPETVYLKKDGSYRIHVVNVNPNEKNVSFILDAFSEHHNTVFGKTRTFTLTPKVDGVFTYLSPETAHQGRIVIAPQPEGRAPASR